MDADKPGKCPSCRTADLTYGRETCQACAAVKAIRTRESAGAA